MKQIAAKNSKFIWMFVLVATAVAIGTVYFVSQSSSKNNAPAAETKANTASSSQEPEAKAETVVTGTTITTGSSKYGPMLFDSRGQAIYIWELEESPAAECYGSCAAAWPPVLTNGKPVASGAVNSKLLGTTKRTDGTTQVTYNGHPLYFYANEKPGEVECHNIKTHGGLWWVIQPSGSRAK